MLWLSQEETGTEHFHQEGFLLVPGSSAHASASDNPQTSNLPLEGTQHKLRRSASDKIEPHPVGAVFAALVELMVDKRGDIGSVRDDIIFSFYERFGLDQKPLVEGAVLELGLVDSVELPN
jgi:hypothetical protein